MWLQPAPGQLQVPAGQAPSVWSGLKAWPELHHLKGLVISVSKKLMGQNPDVSIGVRPPRHPFQQVESNGQFDSTIYDLSQGEMIQSLKACVSHRWITEKWEWQAQAVTTYIYFGFVPCLIRWGITLWCCLNNRWLSAEMCLERTAGAELYFLGMCNR